MRGYHSDRFRMGNVGFAIIKVQPAAFMKFGRVETDVMELASLSYICLPLFGSPPFFSVQN